MHRPEIKTNPTPDQMFELSAIAVCLAKNQDKLSPSIKFDNAQLFIPEKQDDLIFEEDRFKSTTHMFAGRVARSGYSRHRSWSMRLVEKFWVEDDGQSDASRTTYRFEWNNDSVVVANRIIIAPQEEEVIYDADRITPDKSEFDPAWINARYQMAAVTEADCAILVKELRLFSRISQDQVQYNR